MFQGEGEFFTDCDPDSARAFFRCKNRRKTPKLMKVRDAVARFIEPNAYVAIGGFGAIRIPTAICHEIVRQRYKGLGFCGHTSTHDFQILCAGEVFDRCDIAYIIGLEARGLSPNARRYMESGLVRITENSNFGMAMRLKAAAMGVPFMPARNLLGSDTLKYSVCKVVSDPFTGKPLTLHPALFPDVAAIHVHEADIYGNCRMRGISICDLDLACASKRLIITAERIVPHSLIAAEPERTVIPFYQVDAVCEVPYGSYPGNMPNEYYSDEEHLLEWLRVERDPDEFKRFLDRNIYGVESFEDYIRLNGGTARMMELRRQEFLIRGEGAA